ncbi:hypothetical protein [Pedobacter paludis]|nr:hypothetical protein [Pedobacter paludis]
MNVFSSSLTLSSKTWRHLKEQDAWVYQFRSAKRKELLRLKVNNIGFALILTIVMMSVGMGVCFLSKEFIKKYFWFLCFFTFTEEGAKEIVADILASSATIIGLSFVVIGFSFEVVKNATNQTLRNIFRETRLYYVFAISIISILFLVIMTLLKHTVTIYTVGNFAIFSCLLLLATTIAIAYMFAKVITFFNQEKIAKITRDYLVKLATFTMLDDEFLQLTERIYAQEMESLGFTRYISFIPGNENQVVLKSSNRVRVEIVDICLPLIAFASGKVSGRSLPGTVLYQPLQLKSNLNPRHGLFYFNDNVKVKWLEAKIISLGLKTKKSGQLEEEYIQQKQQLQESLIAASEKGDLKQVRERLDDIRQLYSILHS